MEDASDARARMTSACAVAAAVSDKDETSA